MSRIKHSSFVFVSFMLGAAGCGPNKTTGDKPATPSQPDKTAVAPTPPAVEPPAAPTKQPPPVVEPVGMEEPFFTLGPTGWRTLKSGWRSLAKRDYPAAREAFAAVVSAYPDHTEIRFQEVRAALLAGDLAAVPHLWRALLTRDYVGFAGRLDRSKEMAPLRASPAWAELQAVRAEAAKRHGSGLGKGMLFVARAHNDMVPVLEEGGQVKLQLGQEAFHFDPATKRMRKLTDSGGQILAIHRDVEGKRLMLLSGGNLKKQLGKLTFAQMRGSLLSLETGERLGSFVIDGEPESVELCWSDKDEPIWSVRTAETGGRSLTVEATGTTLVTHDQGCGAAVAITKVSPTVVGHHRPLPEEVGLGGDGMQLTGVDGERPLRAAQIIRAGSLGWSPGKKRFVYTGQMDRCQAHQLVVAGGKPTPNAVYVWDTTEKKAERVKAAVAGVETRWLDDDHLVVEVQKGGAVPQITIHDLGGEGGALTLDAPSGAGLHGIPAMPCPDPDTQALVY